MASDPRHRFTVADYYRMSETGVLRPNARMELLDGEVIDVPPAGPFHGGVIARLTEIFNTIANKRWLVWPQNAVRLDEHTELRPAVALLKPFPDDYTSRLPRPEDVYLLIEVSDATLEFDRKEKLPAYGRAGIVEVWIANLQEQTIEVYWEAGFSGYNASAILRTGDKASPLAFQDASVDVGELFSPNS
jgi:Uma2 family endonuclease